MKTVEEIATELLGRELPSAILEIEDSESVISLMIEEAKKATTDAPQGSILGVAFGDCAFAGMGAAFMWQENMMECRTKGINPSVFYPVAARMAAYVEEGKIIRDRVGEYLPVMIADIVAHDDAEKAMEQYKTYCAGAYRYGMAWQINQCANNSK